MFFFLFRCTVLVLKLLYFHVTMIKNTRSTVRPYYQRFCRAKLTLLYGSLKITAHNEDNRTQKSATLLIHFQRLQLSTSTPLISLLLLERQFAKHYTYCKVHTESKEK